MGVGRRWNASRRKTFARPRGNGWTKASSFECSMCSGAGTEGLPLLPSKYPKLSPIWIQDTLGQYLVKDGKTIDDNDVRDMMHAAVPLRCRGYRYLPVWPYF